MADITELANTLSYDVITSRYAAASERVSDAKAELDLMKGVLKYKVAHETEGNQRTSTPHEASGETLNTTIRTIGAYRVQLRESMSTSFNVEGLRETLQAKIAEALVEGDSQVSRRDMLRELLAMLDGYKVYKKSEKFDISTVQE
jgi:hypothetical protein